MEDALSTMSIKRKWLVAALIGVAVLAVVGGAVLSSRGAKTGGASHAASTDATTSAGVTGSATASGAPAPSGSSESTMAVPTNPTVEQPPAQGAELVTITVPPSKTLAMISADNATADSTYIVEFRPYGTGPTRGATATLVVSISKSTPGETAAKPYDLTGRNVLVNLMPQAAETITFGGAYRGTITLRKDGDVLVPWLDDVAATS